MEKVCKHRSEFYTCKRLRMLQWLKEEGFIPFQTLPDVKNPRYNVWRFKNTPELEEAVERYFEQLNNNNQ